MKLFSKKKKAASFEEFKRDFQEPKPKKVKIKKEKISFDPLDLKLKQYKKKKRIHLKKLYKMYNDGEVCTVTNIKVVKNNGV